MNSSVWNKLPTLVAKLAALDQAPVASIWVDATGLIGYVNQRFCKIMGVDEHTLIGLSIQNVVPALASEYWQESWWPLLENEQNIPVLPLAWQHNKGLSVDYNASVSLVDVAELNFAVFYLWPMPLEQKTHIMDCDNDVAALLQHLGESICVLDEQGVIRFVNKAFCQLVAGDEHNIIGSSLLTLLSPAKEQLQKVWQLLQRKISKTECEFTDLAGKIHHIHMSVVPLDNVMQSKNQYLISFVDVTQQLKITQQLEAQNASFERLAANLPGFIYKFRMTPDGQFSFPYASRGCLDIFGVEPSLVVNDATPIVQTIHPDDVPVFQSSIMASAMDLSPWNFEARQKTSEHGWRWFHAGSIPHLQDNGDIIWEGMVMDVTRRKKIEAELAEAKVVAEASAKVKSEFLANMSHEIRTPLNAIIGLNNLLLKSELTAVQQDYLNKVQLSSKNLLGLINNILDFSKIESEKLMIEHIEFNLDSVLENIGVMLEPVAAEKNLALLIDRDQSLPLYLLGDSLRLIQVLVNLCSNAIKFTKQGEVIISVNQVFHDGAPPSIRFSVTDTGIGLSEQQKNDIFTAFSQADNSITRHYGGTGLGLTISKHLIELMGGEIGVNSTEGQGSEFYFTLPLSSDADTSLTRVLPTELDGWHILLIVENKSSCRIYEKMLKDLRFKVNVCSLWNMQLEEILTNQQASEQQAHELILLDWNINESHRADIIRALEDQVFGGGIPVIINISTTEVESTRFFAKRFDNIVFLNKPSTPSYLMDAIFNASGKESLLKTYNTELHAPNMAFYEEAVKGLRILVVEDNEINQEVISKTLEGADISVTLMNNGKEAVDHLVACDPEELYDLVLMDLQMPVMDGYEATITLRQQSRFDTLPIIAMTAHTFDTDKQKCLEVGMQDHISKPIELEAMFATLVRWMHTEQVIYQSKPAAVATDIETKSTADMSAPESALASLSTVNVHEALRLVQGSEKILQRLLLKFAQQQQTVSAQIRQMLLNNEHQQAIARAHEIKGVAGNLHITLVYDAAEQLEAALRAKEQNIVTPLLEQLARAMDQYCQEITGLYQPLADSYIEPISDLSSTNTTAMRDLLEQLIVYLETNNWQAEDCLEQIKRQLNGHYAQDIEIIYNYVVDLEFIKAIDYVKKLQEVLYESL